MKKNDSQKLEEFKILNKIALQYNTGFCITPQDYSKVPPDFYNIPYEEEYGINCLIFSWGQLNYSEAVSLISKSDVKNILDAQSKEWKNILTINHNVSLTHVLVEEQIIPKRIVGYILYRSNIIAQMCIDVCKSNK